MQVIVIFLYVQVHIGDEIFLSPIVTFLEKTYLLCSPVSYLGLYENMYYSSVKFLVNVCYLHLVSKVFHQSFLRFSKMLPGYIIFHRCGFDLGDLGVYSVFLFSCQNLFSIRQEFLNIILKSSVVYLPATSFSG